MTAKWDAGFDYFEHIGGATDFPAGKGARTTSAAAGQAPLGKKVLLHAVIPLSGATGNPGLQKGDGTTSYFTGFIRQSDTSLQSVDMELHDGLGMTGGTAGSWLVIYRVIG